MTSIRSFDSETLEGSGLLTPEQFAFLLAERDVPPAPMAHRPSIREDQVHTIMKAIGVTPVPGRDGLQVYSLILDGKVLVFGMAPDIQKDLIPLEHLTREWVEVASLTDFIAQPLAWANEVREAERMAPALEAEDHPEEHAVGFFAPGINRVWLLKTQVLTEDLTEGNFGRWGQVPHLIQSSTGRQELAKLIAAGKLQSAEDYYRSLAGQEKPPRREDIVIDLLSGALADRYKHRYMKGGADAPEA